MVIFLQTLLLQTHKEDMALILGVLLQSCKQNDEVMQSWSPMLHKRVQFATHKYVT
jgi:hypothetical protein